MKINIFYFKFKYVNQTKQVYIFQVLLISAKQYNETTTKIPDKIFETK